MTRTTSTSYPFFAGHHNGPCRPASGWHMEVVYGGEDLFREAHRCAIFVCHVSNFFVAAGTCRTCGAVVAALTYRLRRHAEACFQRATPVGPPQRPMVQKKFAVPKADSNAVRYAIARAIFSMGVPFKCIDNPHFQSMLTRAFPGVDCYPLFVAFFFLPQE